MMFKELLRLTIVAAICFFLLSGAGVFTFWFWLMLFT